MIYEGATGLEIAANFEIDLSLLTVASYQGDSGEGDLFHQWSGSDFQTTVVDGGSLAWSTTLGSFQNSMPGGIAISYNNNFVQLLSYGGNVFYAEGGPADGQFSTDLGTPLQGSGSLQLEGNGSAYSDFHWVNDVPTTWGALNPNQTIVAIPAPSALALIGLASMRRHRRRR